MAQGSMKSVLTMSGAPRKVEESVAASAGAQAPLEKIPPYDFAASGVKEDEEARAIYEELRKRLEEETQGVDYKSVYERMLEDVKSTKPEAGRLHPFKAFAISVGGGPGALKHAEEVVGGRNEEATRNWQEILAIKEQAIRGDIQQQLEKGKFKQALVQSEALDKLQTMRERFKGEREHARKMEVEGLKEEGRMAREKFKAQGAMSRLQRRIENMADSFHIDEKIKLALVNHSLGFLRARATKQDITGDFVVSGQDLIDSEDYAIGQVEDLIGQDLPGGKPASEIKPKPGTTPPKAGVTPPASGGETPEQKALREIREARKAKPK